MSAATALLISLALGVNSYLDRGRTLVGQLKYEEAEAELRRAKYVMGSTPAEKRETFELLAWVLSGLGKMDECELAYRELLTFAPDAKPPDDAPPKLLSVFRHAKEAVYPADYVRLTQLPTAPGQLDISVVDPWQRVDEVVVLETRDGGAYVARKLTRTQSRFTGALSPLPVGESCRWYIEARSKGAPVGTLGSASQPFFYEASSAPPPVVLTPVAPAPVAEEPAPAAVVEAPPRTPTKPVRLIGVGLVVVTVAGLVFGFVTNEVSASAYRQADMMGSALEVTRLDDQAINFAMARNGFFVAAGVSALAAALCLWLGG